jgi:hypothetical protein
VAADSRTTRGGLFSGSWFVRERQTYRVVYLPTVN